MKILLAITLFAGATCFAADSGDALSEPKTFLKIVTAIESSKISELTSSKDEHGTSYHLRRAEFLGTVRRDGRTYTIAHAVFIRSSPLGQDTPPPRGHDFIVVLDPKFNICGVGRTTFGEYYMKGERLYFGAYDDNNKPCADFGSTAAFTRYRGYIEIGLEYPFPDRISEENWQTGAFLKSLSVEDKKSGLYPKQ
ncbi:MAG: hypothetical protein K8R87_09930 [Verrucomicrobia bacterium]|nr:hypothetical protein [Verrucomicrobiota bacterium]